MTESDSHACSMTLVHSHQEVQLCPKLSMCIYLAYTVIYPKQPYFMNLKSASSSSKWVTDEYSGRQIVELAEHALLILISCLVNHQWCYEWDFRLDIENDRVSQKLR